jgi:hypothetical protein
MPAYGYPEAAVAAVARAAGYGAWRAEPRGRVPDFPDVKITEARALVREFLKHAPAGGWLPPEQAADLLRGYGISPAADQDTPVTLGTGTGTGTGTGVAEVTVRVTADDIFGPLVALGLPGATVGVFADRAARLTPLTDTDADRLIRSVRSVRSAGLLPGHEAAAAALRDLVLRVSRLADDLPQVTDLRLDTVIAGPAGILVADARIMVTPSEHKDPFLRRLR